jgi:NAD(P)-dependent dehydrogenase (short-subunit alcohol dehydrogenase family)
MNIAGSVVLVTGANRGLGASFCRALLERGAAKVYAGARDIASVQMEGVVPVPLDITSAADIAAAVERCGDTTLLINNAGILTGRSALSDDALEIGRREFETNVFGTLAMSQAFAPVLRANGGGAIINVLSVLSWLASPGAALYCASKAATWSLTNALRLDLLSQQTQVMALHVGLMKTDMTAGMQAPKVAPDGVAIQALDGLEAGAFEVLADESSRRVRSALSAGLEALYPALA